MAKEKENTAEDLLDKLYSWDGIIEDVLSQGNTGKEIKDPKAIEAYDQLIKSGSNFSATDAVLSLAAQLLTKHFSSFISKERQVMKVLLSLCTTERAQAVRIHTIRSLLQIIKQELHLKQLSQETQEKMDHFIQELMTKETSGVIVRHMTQLQKALVEMTKENQKNQRNQNLTNDPKKKEEKKQSESDATSTQKETKTSKVSNKSTPATPATPVTPATPATTAGDAAALAAAPKKKAIPPSPYVFIGNLPKDFKDVEELITYLAPVASNVAPTDFKLKLGGGFRQQQLQLQPDQQQSYAFVVLSDAKVARKVINFILKTPFRNSIELTADFARGTPCDTIMFMMPKALKALEKQAMQKDKYKQQDEQQQEEEKEQQQQQQEEEEEEEEEYVPINWKRKTHDWRTLVSELRRFGELEENIKQNKIKFFNVDDAKHVIKKEFPIGRWHFVPVYDPEAQRAVDQLILKKRALKNQDPKKEFALKSGRVVGSSGKDYTNGDSSPKNIPLTKENNKSLPKTDSKRDEVRQHDEKPRGGGQREHERSRSPPPSSYSARSGRPRSGSPPPPPPPPSAHGRRLSRSRSRGRRGPPSPRGERWGPPSPRYDNNNNDRDRGGRYGPEFERRSRSRSQRGPGGPPPQRRGSSRSRSPMNRGPGNYPPQQRRRSPPRSPRGGPPPPYHRRGSRSRSRSPPRDAYKFPRYDERGPPPPRRPGSPPYRDSRDRYAQHRPHSPPPSRGAPPSKENRTLAEMARGREEPRRPSSRERQYLQREQGRDRGSRDRPVGDDRRDNWPPSSNDNRERSLADIAREEKDRRQDQQHQQQRRPSNGGQGGPRGDYDQGRFGPGPNGPGPRGRSRSRSRDRPRGVSPPRQGLRGGRGSGPRDDYGGRGGRGGGRGRGPHGDYRGRSPPPPATKRGRSSSPAQSSLATMQGDPKRSVSASPKRRKVASPHPSPSTKKVAVSPAAASRPASNVFDEIEEDMVDYEDEE